MATFTLDTYRDQYQESVQNPSSFWEKIAKRELEWFTPWSAVFTHDPPHYTWFADATLNITHNCLDRHVRDGAGDCTAYIWVNEQGEHEQVTYAVLLDRVSRFAAGLQQLGVRKGDRVVLYLPTSIQQAVAMLACARLGAIHSVVFAGFSAHALSVRLTDLQPKVVITATHTWRRGRRIPLLQTVEEACADTPAFEHLVVWNRTDEAVAASRPTTNFSALEATNAHFPAVPHHAEDPLFVLYTSGTTGKPKGILHTMGGYSLNAHVTTRYVFQPQSDDIYWCTADAGWITGHSYVVYGPLSNGMTTLLVEGAPDYPTSDWWWKLIAEHRVSVFYTAPTTIRLFMRLGEEGPRGHDLSSLRLLGSVGEPLNPEAWHWYHRVIGHERATIVDTWWQTETGAHMLVTLPGLPQKPGKAGLPFFGVQPVVLDEQGNEQARNVPGKLYIRHPWPSALRTCWRNDERYAQYWNQQPSLFATGDMAFCDEDGYYQVLGRTDDVMNTAGHRLSSAELENVLIEHPAVAESAVVAAPDEIRGEVPHAFVVLRRGHEPSSTIEQELQALIDRLIGKFARCAAFTFVEKLPKTRSGKIMRRVLRAQLTGEDIGDTSTMEN